MEKRHNLFLAANCRLYIGNDTGAGNNVRFAGEDILDLDKIDDIKRFHVGMEVMYKFAGIDIGPTFAWKDSKPYYGFSVIPFGGALIIPYVNYTYIKGIDDQFDLGAYLKIPIPFFSKRFSFGG